MHIPSSLGQLPTVPAPPQRRPQVYRELSVGLDYCFQILKRLSFGKAVDLFGMEPEDKIKTEGGSCRKRLCFGKRKIGHWSLWQDNGDNRWLWEVTSCSALEMLNGEGQPSSLVAVSLPRVSLEIGTLLLLSVYSAWYCVAGAQC